MYNKNSNRRSWGWGQGSYGVIYTLSVPLWMAVIKTLANKWGICRDHSGNGLNQWEMLLQCNSISHWLSPYPEWSWGVQYMCTICSHYECPGDHDTNSSWAHNPNLVKKLRCDYLKNDKIRPQFKAHDVIAEHLLWHMLKCDLIGSLYAK